jgi:hypothetical protein
MSVEVCSLSRAVVLNYFSFTDQYKNSESSKEWPPIYLTLYSTNNGI